jgi:thiosulfate/3-mercaptopyruvate sulfurtransferase
VTSPPAPPRPFISASELADRLLEADPPAVLDASILLHSATFDGDYRKDILRDRWVEAHIPGSQYVNVAEEFSDTDAPLQSAPLHYVHPEPQAIADELARLGIARGREVVVYDSTGTLFAARLWYLLRWIGVPVRVLDGGFGAWVAGGHPVATGDEDAPEPVPTWAAEPVRRAWVSKEELLERIAAGSEQQSPLVCALPRGSFTGADPTRYSRRGRIPGSVNVSSRDLFTADHHVKSRVELILAYQAEGVDIGDREVLLYCGGGISASASALTLAAIGQSAVRIYDGSLEEWSADPELPLEVGEPA